MTEKEKASHTIMTRFILTDKNFVLKQNKAIKLSSALESKGAIFLRLTFFIYFLPLRTTLRFVCRKKCSKVRMKIHTTKGFFSYIPFPPSKRTKKSIKQKTKNIATAYLVYAVVRVDK